MCELRPGCRRFEAPCEPPLEPLGRPLPGAAVRERREPSRNRQFRRKRERNLGLESRPEENIRVPPARSLWSFAAKNSFPGGKGNGPEGRPYTLFRVAQDRPPEVWPGVGGLWPEKRHLAERGRRPGRARSSEPTGAVPYRRQSTAR